MKNYPDALKNFSKTKRKKAIEIINALLEDGYDEARAIPIAISQIKKWADDSTKTKQSENSDLTKADEQVKPHNHGGWQVIAKDAIKAAKIYHTKKEAIKRAAQIAQNKHTKVQVFNQNEELQREFDPN